MATGIESLRLATYTGAQTPNSTSFQYQAITSRVIAGVHWQICTYWSNGGKLVLGKRQLPLGEWSMYLYDGVEQPLTIALSVDDSHNSTSAEIDADGYVHVSYDHHVAPLNYRRSNAPLAAWTGGLTAELPLLGTNETAVSYPSFFRDPATGALNILFRDGTSSAGDWYWYTYSTASATWAAATGTSTAGLLLEGTTDANQNPYLYGLPKYSDDWDGVGVGYMHISWTWRLDELPVYNQDIMHMRWSGIAWSRMDGSAQTIPATIANSQVIKALDTTTQIYNQADSAVDAAGNPHIFSIHSDGTRHQLWDIYYNGSAWVTQNITGYTDANTYSNHGRPRALRDKDTDEIYVYTTMPLLEGQGIIQWKSGAGNFSTWTKSTFYAATLGTHEPSVDVHLWEVEREVCMWVVRGRDISTGLEAPRIVQRAPKGYDTSFSSSTWSRSHAITIDHTKIGAGGVSGYTVTLTKANFASEMFDPVGAFKAQPDAGDLRFFSDAALTTPIACHIIDFALDSSSGAGDGKAEILIGQLTLSDATDTTIYVAYHADHWCHQPFWDETGGALGVRDSNWLYSISLSRSRTNEAKLDDLFISQYYASLTDSAGKIGGAIDLTGTSGINLGTKSMGIASGGYALAVWVNVDATLTDYGSIIGADKADGVNRAVQFRVSNIDGKAGFIRFNDAAAVTTNIVGTTDLRGAGWKRVVAEFNPASGSVLRVNGTQEASDALTTAQADKATQPWGIGYRLAAVPDDYFKGSLDQVEIHKTSRGAAWWTTDYNNQNAPATFAIAGTAGTIGGVEIALAGAGITVSTATGAMSVSIPLTGSALAEATATGDLTTLGSTALAGNATATANASGGLSLSIPLSGSAVAQALAAAGITVGKPLTGAAATGHTVYARPDGTIDGVGYTPVGAATIHECLNEVTPNDETYIYGSSDAVTVSLSNIPDPGISTGHVVRFRGKADSGWAAVRLQQGDTLIASKYYYGTFPTVWTNDSFTLTEAEANAITDYNNLQLYFAGLIGTTSFSWAEFSVEVPGVEATGAITKDISLDGNGLSEAAANGDLYTSSGSVVVTTQDNNNLDSLSLVLVTGITAATQTDTLFSNISMRDIGSLNSLQHDHTLTSLALSKVIGYSVANQPFNTIESTASVIIGSSNIIMQDNDVVSSNARVNINIVAAMAGDNDYLNSEVNFELIANSNAEQGPNLLTTTAHILVKVFGTWIQTSDIIESTGKVSIGVQANILQSNNILTSGASGASGDNVLLHFNITQDDEMLNSKIYFFDIEKVEPTIIIFIPNIHTLLKYQCNHNIIGRKR